MSISNFSFEKLNPLSKDEFSNKSLKVFKITVLFIFTSLSNFKILCNSLIFSSKIPRVIESSLLRHNYKSLSAIFTTHPSHVYGAYWFGWIYSSKFIYSILGFKQFSSISPQWEIIPSLTPYVKSKFVIFPSGYSQIWF